MFHPYHGPVFRAELWPEARLRLIYGFKLSAALVDQTRQEESLGGDPSGNIVFSSQSLSSPRRRNYLSLENRDNPSFSPSSPQASNPLPWKAPRRTFLLTRDPLKTIRLKKKDPEANCWVLPRGEIESSLRDLPGALSPSVSPPIDGSLSRRERPRPNGFDSFVSWAVSWRAPRPVPRRH